MKKLFFLLSGIALLSLSGCKDDEGNGTYSVRATTNGHGVAVAMLEDADVSTAVQGQTITLTATPEEGYLFSRWIVLAGGPELESRIDATTAFVMPAADVAVRAEFVAEVIRTYAIAFEYEGESADDYQGSAVAQIDGNPVSRSMEGRTITVTATPKHKYEFVRWLITKGDVDLESTTDATTTFTMPASLVTLMPEFELILYPLTVSGDDNGTAVATVDENEVTEIDEGQTVTITATPKNGYEFTRWTVVSGEVELDSTTDPVATFTMPGSAVEIRAEFAAIPTYPITMGNDGNGLSFATVYGETVALAPVGETVTILAAPNSGYEFSSWTVVSGGITLASATDASTTFTMPATAVQISATFNTATSTNSIKTSTTTAPSGSRVTDRSRYTATSDPAPTGSSGTTDDPLAYMFTDPAGEWPQWSKNVVTATGVTITFDLGDVTGDINGFQLGLSHANNSFTRYTVQTSADGTNWTDQHQGTVSVAGSLNQYFTFSKAVNARYIRVHASAMGSAANARVNGFWIYR